MSISVMLNLVQRGKKAVLEAETSEKKTWLKLHKFPETFKFCFLDKIAVTEIVCFEN